MLKDKTLQVFEHSFLPIGETFEPRHFVALSKLIRRQHSCLWNSWCPLQEWFCCWRSALVDPQQRKQQQQRPTVPLQPLSSSNASFGIAASSSTICATTNPSSWSLGASPTADTYSIGVSAVDVGAFGSFTMEWLQRRWFICICLSINHNHTPTTSILLSPT